MGLQLGHVKKKKKFWKKSIIVFHVILHCNNWSAAAKIGLSFPHILPLYDLT